MSEPVLTARIKALRLLHIDTAPKISYICFVKMEKTDVIVVKRPESEEQQESLEISMKKTEFNPQKPQIVYFANVPQASLSSGTV